MSYCPWVFLIFLLGVSLLSDQSIGNTKEINLVTETKMMRIPSGVLRPFYPIDSDHREIFVEGFHADVYPATNQEFLQFVKKHPEWRRENVSRLFVDEKYLSHWESSTSLGNQSMKLRPVTHVSWFAAKAYCKVQDKRLPTENEWEYIASASEQNQDGRSDQDWRQKVLDWYSQPNRGLRKIGEGQANYYGVHDLHGLIWEWVMDFNSSLLASDNRNAGDEIKNRFCGAGAVAASEKEDYASFMRLAFRSSLQAKYTTSNLGFRCVRSL